MRCFVFLQHPLEMGKYQNKHIDVRPVLGQMVKAVGNPPPPLSLAAPRPGDASNGVQPRCLNLLSTEWEASVWTRLLIRTGGKWEKRERGRTDSPGSCATPLSQLQLFQVVMTWAVSRPRFGHTQGFSLAMSQHSSTPTQPYSATMMRTVQVSKKTWTR